MTTTPDSSNSSHGTPIDDSLRPHSFDGIQEYDKRLPRWWLITLYGAIVFAFIYWAYYHTYALGSTPGEVLEKKMAQNAAEVAKSSGVIDDAGLWRMSQDPPVLAAGKVTFDTLCAACHKPDMSGLIGPNLLDNQWIHGGKPMDSIKVVNEGSLAKGMPPWGPILGTQKISEVTAYIFSKHKPGEEVVAVPGWTPPPGAVPVPLPVPVPESTPTAAQ